MGCVGRRRRGLRERGQGDVFLERERGVKSEKAWVIISVIYVSLIWNSEL